ncbi:MAG TPA: ATP-binding cassette domain-containing protein [Candidatus Saccharimonadales bacterium]|nr:ATP-binding cassette domain-containing protein [Candidatus Saccharimonadales bacterium]
MIEFRDVHFRFGPLKVLDGVSFKVRQGSTKVILGPSGTGKSTVLKLILGLLKPERGQVLLDGVDVATARRDELMALRRKVGMVFQEGALFDSLTVGENVGYSFLERSRMTLEEVEAEVRRHLTLVGLDPELIDQLPDQLSVGMQRRVAIARALAACNPTHMLYDEPTTGLDPITLETITDVIVRLKEELGITSVVVTHQIPDALKVGSSFLMLGAGKVVFDGNAEALAACEVPFVMEFLEPFKKTLRGAFHSLHPELNAGQGTSP